MDDRPVIIPQVVAERVAGGRSRHRILLALAAIVAALAWSLEVRPDERVAFRGFSRWPLPQSCYSRALFGVPCPGCGLTRSFVFLARGDWPAAWREHRLGWLLAGLVVLQFPYRLWALAAGKEARLSPKVVTALAVALTILMFANWAAGLIGAM